MEYVVKTRFNIGDRVWVINNNIPLKTTIQEITFCECKYSSVLINESMLEYGIVNYGGGLKYTLSGGYDLPESRIYATKEEMIEKLFGVGKDN